MNLWMILDWVLLGLELLVSRTRGKLDDEVYGYLRAALENVKRAHAAKLTRARLEALRAKPRW